MKGFNAHRHADNPMEKKLHDKFVERYFDGILSPHALDMLVHGPSDHGYPKEYLSDHEKRIVLSTIQWLGSPVGEGFLRECGYEIPKGINNVKR